MCRYMVGGVLLCLLASESYAGPITIEVLNEWHRTDLQAQIYESDGTVTTAGRTKVSSSDGLTDSMLFGVDTHASYMLGASAEASLFDVSGYAGAWMRDTGGVMFATALSETVMEFVPTVESFAPLAINAFGTEYTSAYVSLFDVTSNQTLWSYGWDSIGPPYPDVPPTFFGYNFVDSPLSSGPLGVATYLDRTHSYRLTSFIEMDANDDNQTARVQVTGLRTVAVPEPSSLLLLAIGVVVSGSIRRRRSENIVGREEIT